jgi:hypothetical protein
MTTGSAADITDRVKRLIPNSWFKWVAPYRDAVIGGIADGASWCYGLIGYARQQTRLFTASGIWLDIFAFDFLGRTLQRTGAQDDAFRALIRATILQERVTRAGMINAVTTLTGKAPTVFEPWNTFDTGAYSGPLGQCGQLGYGVGQGGYGNMRLHGQVFMQVHRGGPSGIPNVGGYGNNAEGYGVGQTEYAGPYVEQSGITNAMIYRVINLTKATGTTIWTAFT